MPKPNRTLLAALFMSLAAATAAPAQSAKEMNQTLDELFGAHAPYEAFFQELKKAVAANDKRAVASMIDYPFKARINDKAVTIRDAAHFAADFDKVFTAKVKQAVARQDYAALFANWQGVMIGDGEVWFGGVCSSAACEKQDIRITAVND